MAQVPISDADIFDLLSGAAERDRALRHPLLGRRPRGELTSNHESLVVAH